MDDPTESVDLTAIRAVTALGEDQRRRLYGFVRAARRPVSREESAAALGISRKLAAFHLDKLVEAGLLRHHFVQTARPRVGRRPKVYEPTDADFHVSIPARSHELLAEILVQAMLSEPARGPARQAANDSAFQRGYSAGAQMRERIRPGRLGSERALSIAQQVLAAHGFEPSRTDLTCVRLRNCPFHPLARDAPEFVCGLNHAFVRGLIDGLQATSIDAVLAPSAGECCVELRATGASK